MHITDEMVMAAANEYQSPRGSVVDRTERALQAAFDAIEPDMFWDANNPENFGGDNANDTAIYIADNADHDGDKPITAVIQCAYRLPNREMKIMIVADECGDLKTEWEWVE